MDVEKDLPKLFVLAPTYDFAASQAREQRLVQVGWKWLGSLTDTRGYHGYRVWRVGPWFERWTSRAINELHAYMDRSAAEFVTEEQLDPWRLDVRLIDKTLEERLFELDRYLSQVFAGDVEDPRKVAAFRDLVLAKGRELLARPEVPDAQN